MAIRSELEVLLVPFEEAQETLQLQAKAARSGTEIDLEYTVSGNLEGLRRTWDKTGEIGERKDGLWNSTCFEAFIAEAGQPFYWEFNLSTALEWNLFHFRGYREGKKPETRLLAPEAQVLENSADCFRVHARLRLARLIGDATTLDLSMTAVLDHSGARKTYWAAAHPGPQPDFHLRRAFSQRL